MKYIILQLMMLTTIISANAQTKDEQKLGVAIEKFRLAMIDPNPVVFEELMSADLSYGHSGGLVEDKKSCIASMVDGKFNFEAIKLSEQTLKITGQTAVVRHIFSAETHDAGKDKASIKLSVMMIWIKTSGNWKLLARQSVRL